MQVKNFWAMQLKSVPANGVRPWYNLTAAARQQMVGRGKHVAVTGDFGRPYRCLTTRLLCGHMLTAMLRAQLQLAIAWNACSPEISC